MMTNDDGDNNDDPRSALIQRAQFSKESGEKPKRFRGMIKSYEFVANDSYK